MSSLPEPIAKHIVQMAAATHGPIVRINFDIIHAHCNCRLPEEQQTCEPDTVECFNVWQNQEITVEFQDNSAVAMADLPAYSNARMVSMFTGAHHSLSSGPITLYFKVRNSVPERRWSSPQQFGNPYGRPGHKWTGHDNGDDGHGRLVIVRSMKLINPGTWQPTAT
jgi:hypothetical protein